MSGSHYYTADSSTTTWTTSSKWLFFILYLSFIHLIYLATVHLNKELGTFPLSATFILGARFDNRQNKRQWAILTFFVLPTRREKLLPWDSCWTFKVNSSSRIYWQSNRHIKTQSICYSNNYQVNKLLCLGESCSAVLLKSLPRFKVLFLKMSAACHQRGNGQEDKERTCSLLSVFLKWDRGGRIYLISGFCLFFSS
jgi:hypothetical protein